MQGQNLLYVEMYVRRYGATAMLVKYTELTASLARELNSLCTYCTTLRESH